MKNRKIKTPDWVRGRTIYEVNLRQFSTGGSLKEFEEHLPRLRDLGVGILWFMPIYPIGKTNRKGSLGSYYSISNYISLNPEFGTLDEFKSLVRKIHDLDMKIIIDWVANHTAWDHHWTISHPEFYHRDEEGNFKAPFPDWEDVIHLDYSNSLLWDEMINQMSFWIREADIDGFRCDMAHLVPTLFWNLARRELDKIKPVFMLAESENHDLLEYAFDAIYNWKLMHAMNDLAAGKILPNELINTTLREVEHFPDGAFLLNFTSNHDENSWQGSAIERLHNYLEPLSVLTFLLPGIPLIYNGQEAGNYKRLRFFDKDLVEWKEDKMYVLYKTLIKLRSRYPELWSNGEFERIENDSEESVVAVQLSHKKSGESVIAFINVSNNDLDFYIKCRKYEDYYINIFDFSNYSLNCQKSINLKAFGYIILEKEVKIHFW